MKEIGLVIEKVSYGGWDNCVQISNGIVDLVVTVDVGPRIIRYGFLGKENEFSEIKETLGHTGGDKWKIYGGHRLWHSPEHEKRTYQPDNSSVKWGKIHNGIRTIQDIEAVTGIKKEMEIALSPDSSAVEILHRLTNTFRDPVELSVWSISAMATGGMEVIPLEGIDTGLLPNRRMSLWPYTRLNDSRLYLGGKYLVLRQDPTMKHPFKLGVCNEKGWAVYFNNNHLFTKHYKHDQDAAYPDFGVSYETYTNDFMLELETLSPFSIIEEGKYLEHRERWELFDGVPMPGNDENEIDAILRERVDPYSI